MRDHLLTKISMIVVVALILCHVCAPVQAIPADTARYGLRWISLEQAGLNGIVETLSDSLEVQSLLAEGDVFYRRLDNQLAITAYKKAYEIDSLSYPVLSRLARTSNDLGKDLLADDKEDEAEEVFQDAMYYAQKLEIEHPDSAKTHYFLAQTKSNLAYLQGGRQKVMYGREVKTHCLKGMAINPTDAEVIITYGVFNREIATTSWMERTLAEALFGGIPEATREESVALLTRAVELEPEMHLARFELAKSLIAVGKSEEAILHLKQAEVLPAKTTQDNRNRQLAIRMLNRMPQ